MALLIELLAVLLQRGRFTTHQTCEENETLAIQYCRDIATRGQNERSASAIGTYLGSP